MLIVQITQDFFSHGAVMRRARQETQALIEARHSVIAITDLKSRSAVKEMENFRKNLKIVPIKPVFLYSPFRRVASQLTFALKTYFVLKKINRNQKIDLIVSHASTVCYPVAVFGRKNNIPTAWVIQDLIRDRMATGNPYNWMETLLLKYSDPYALRNIDYILPVSKYTKQLALIDGADSERTLIRYNSINSQLFKPYKNKEKDIDVLFFGRLSIEKGVDILIKAVELINKKLRLVVLGTGPMGKDLKKQAERSDQKIEFWGFVEHQKLPQIINRAKVVVVPSRSECHAAVPLEAMACGVPVIASNVAGMEDSIEDGISGWILKENNPNILASYIENALNNENLKDFAINARRRAEKFSIEKFKVDLVKFYEKLIQEFRENNSL